MNLISPAAWRRYSDVPTYFDLIVGSSYSTLISVARNPNAVGTVGPFSTASAKTIR